MREELNQILAKHTNQPLEKIQNDTDRDLYMNGLQAKEYGIIDKVVESREKIKNIQFKEDSGEKEER